MTPSRSGSPKSQPRLIALLDGRVVGTVFRDARARYRFTYEADWRLAEDSYPLSLSMPLTAAEHHHKEVEAFLWGLLPDNERTLDRYAKTFGVSARNPLAILAHIGADCAGAVQFIAPDQLQELEGQQATAEVDWIDDAEVARALRSARKTGLPGRDRKTVGRFSLAGAQPKIALYNGDGRWGKPLGRTPTTHILKPPAAEYAGFAENEHLCLALASELGLGAAKSFVQSFAGEVAIVVERFDRLPHGSSYRRIHQEDLCQAMSVLPWSKYENDGGPGIAAIVPLIQESSIEPEADVGRFLDIIALNWVLAAPDAHAKNYALLHAPGGGVRLAPFYDVASYLPYSDRRLYEVKLAMRIGREYLARKIVRADWITLADASKLPKNYVLARLDALLPRIPEAVNRVASRAIAEGLNSAVVEQTASRIVARSTDCIARLTVDIAPSSTKDGLGYRAPPEASPR